MADGFPWDLLRLLFIPAARFGPRGVSRRFFLEISQVFFSLRATRFERTQARGVRRRRFRAAAAAAACDGKRQQGRRRFLDDDDDDDARPVGVP